MTTKRTFVTTLSPQALETAVRELNENPEVRNIEVKSLRERLERYPGLNARTDNEFLLRFLRARKFDQEESFKLVLNYYRARIEDTEVFQALRPSVVRHVYESGYSTPLAIKDRKGAAVVLEKPGKWDYSRFTELDLIKADVMTIGKVIEDEETQVYGITLIIDYEGFTLSHLAHMSTSFANRMCKLWQDVFPARLQGVHIINEPTSFSNIFNLFKPFIKQKLLQRILFHGSDYSGLHEYIDPGVLPRAYGGSRENPCDTMWADRILTMDKEFEQDSKYGFVDMLMQGGNNSCGNEKGVAGDLMPGTFKKLDI